MEGFADIEGPLRIGLVWLLLYAAAGLLVLLLSYALYRLQRRRRGLSGTGSVVPGRSPLEIALERLNNLQSGGAQLEADPFVVEVSDIVRDYLERSLALPAREQTSEEFLYALQTHPDLPQVLKDHMPPFLGQCDLVKFARQSLEGSQREILLKTAGAVVVETDASLRPAEGVNRKEAAAV